MLASRRRLGGDAARRRVSAISTSLRRLRGAIGVSSSGGTTQGSSFRRTTPSPRPMPTCVTIATQSADQRPRKAPSGTLRKWPSPTSDETTRHAASTARFVHRGITPPVLVTALICFMDRRRRTTSVGWKRHRTVRLRNERPGSVSFSSTLGMNGRKDVTSNLTSVTDERSSKRRFA